MYQLTLQLPFNGFYIRGTLTLPINARSLIIFAPGAGKTSTIPLQKTLAKKVQQSRLATLKFDLLGDSQSLTEFYNDTTRLTSGLVATTRWLKGHSQFKELHLGYLGIGTGAAVAFKAAAELPMYIEGIISINGRVDLIPKEMKLIQYPSLLIAGERDFKTVNINQHAINYLKGSKQMVIIPGASHPFEEKDKLEELSRIIAGWTDKYMTHKKSVAML